MPDPHRRARRSATAALTAAMLGSTLPLTAGCASSTTTRPRPTTTTTSVSHSSSAPARTGSTAETRSAPGSHSGAEALAARVPGCTPQPLSVPAAANRLGLTRPTQASAAAACTLRGLTAIILSFATAADQAATDRQLATRVTYYTTGTGWSAAPTDTSEPVGQQSVVQDIALALHGTIHTAGD